MEDRKQNEEEEEEKAVEEVYIENEERGEREGVEETFDERRGGSEVGTIVWALYALLCLCLERERDRGREREGRSKVSWFGFWQRENQDFNFQGLSGWH